MAAAVDALWPEAAPISGLVVTRYQPRAAGLQRPRPAASKWSKPRTRCPTPPAPTQRNASLELPQAWAPTTWCCAWSPAAVPRCCRCRPRPVAGGQAGRQPGAAEERRGDRRDELRPQAPVGDQGRPAGRAVRAGACREPADQRRARRRARGHRRPAHGSRREHLCGRAGDPRTVMASTLPPTARRAAQRRLRDAEAGRSSFNGHEVHMIATPQQSLEAAAQLAHKRGWTRTSSATRSRANRARSARCMRRWRVRWRGATRPSPGPASSSAAARPR